MVFFKNIYFLHSSIVCRQVTIAKNLSHVETPPAVSGDIFPCKTEERNDLANLVAWAHLGVDLDSLDQFWCFLRILYHVRAAFWNGTSITYDLRYVHRKGVDKICSLQGPQFGSFLKLNQNISQNLTLQWVVIVTDQWRYIGVKKLIS